MISFTKIYTVLDKKNLNIGKIVHSCLNNKEKVGFFLIHFLYNFWKNKDKPLKERLFKFKDQRVEALVSPAAMFFLVMVLLLILYIAFDINYFIRTICLVGFGKFFKSKKSVLDTTSITGWCTTQDLDIFMRHMNNSRYMRDLDFARFDFYVTTGLYDEMKKRDGHALQGATTIRYRRPIATFMTYKILTRLTYWEDKAIYLEHRFITPDNFVRAVVISKQNTINFNPIEVIKSLAKDKYRQPDMPPELSQWLTSIETLSAKLRKSD